MQILGRVCSPWCQSGSLRLRSPVQQAWQQRSSFLQHRIVSLPTSHKPFYGTPLLRSKGILLANGYAATSGTTVGRLWGTRFGQRHHSTIYYQELVNVSILFLRIPPIPVLDGVYKRSGFEFQIFLCAILSNQPFPTSGKPADREKIFTFELHALLSKCLPSPLPYSARKLSLGWRPSFALTVHRIH